MLNRSITSTFLSNPDLSFFKSKNTISLCTFLKLTNKQISFIAYKSRYSLK